MIKLGLFKNCKIGLIFKCSSIYILCSSFNLHINVLHLYNYIKSQEESII